MTDDTIFSGAIPALYDRLLGPVIFAPYASDMARRVASITDGAVLETAAGTGILTQALAETLPASVTITAIDLNQPMLDHAARKPALARVTLRQADAQDLPFPDASFDAVICQFGAMFFPDRVRAFRDARRVLKPNGRFLFSVWGPLARNPVSDLVAQALRAAFPDDPPSFYERMPFGYHDAERISDDLLEAGFTSVASETVTLCPPLASVRDIVAGLCQGTPIRAEIEARDPGGLARATDAATRFVIERLGDGPVENAMCALVVTASG